MQTMFSGKKITGILGILPERSYTFEEETQDFSSLRAKRLKKVMGYGQRRRAKKETSTADLCIYGMRKLLDENRIAREEIGALIVVTLTPDYFLPHVSNIIQGECGLSHDVLCLDIPQGCAGYILGLLESFMLLEHMKDKKVVLVTGDVVNRKERDNEIFINPPSGGDAAAITIIENCVENNDIYVDIKTCGEERNALIYPGGGFRFPQGHMFEDKVDIGDGELREPYAINMDGTMVFNFAQREVPILLDELFSFAGKEKEDIDYFLFHQPNQFMLEKLAEKINVPKDKLFMNLVERYGNSNASTIPLVIADNLADKVLVSQYNCCLTGFGAGLALGGILMPLGNMSFCEIVNSNL
ncbi:MAG: hypothetical protein K2N24_12105 [Lachnospiraceae bacterium]|nr:hypothetical protein [Lachnospiraceae bacterium]